jgi:hypothetical protein
MNPRFSYAARLRSDFNFDFAEFDDEFDVASPRPSQTIKNDIKTQNIENIIATLSCFMDFRVCVGAL